MEDKYYNKKQVLQKIKNISLISILTLGIFFEMYGLCKEDFKKDKLYSLIEKKADTNKDFFTNHEEWKKVYDFLDKNYNIFNSEPRFELSVLEMEKYLNKK